MANFLDPNGTARGEAEARNALIAHVRQRTARLESGAVRNVFGFATVDMRLFEGWPEEKLPVFLGAAGVKVPGGTPERGAPLPARPEARAA